jgi:2'-5' RNA ligase
VSRDAATLRVFYALVPPPALAIALGDLARDVARRAHGRPVPAENIHLTLAFIGAWPTARLASLMAAGAAIDSEPMRIMLDTQGGFRRAGIAWIGGSSPPPALAA